MITVDEMMTTNVQGLSATDTLATALGMMSKYGYHHIPVLGANAELIGLVSHRDVLAALGSSLQPDADKPRPDDIALGDVMVRDVFSVRPGTPLRKAAMYIRSQRYGCLPVLEEGRLVGIITDSDFVNIAIDLLEQLELAESEEV